MFDNALLVFFVHVQQVGRSNSVAISSNGLCTHRKQFKFLIRAAPN